MTDSVINLVSFRLELIKYEIGHIRKPNTLGNW